jgi:hypothetical protein
MERTKAFAPCPLPKKISPSVDSLRKQKELNQARKKKKLLGIK